MIFCSYEMIDILRNNNFNTPEVRISDVYVSNKRAKQTQRRILKVIQAVSIVFEIFKPMIFRGSISTRLIVLLKKPLPMERVTKTRISSRWSPKPSQTRIKVTIKPF